MTDHVCAPHRLSVRDLQRQAASGNAPLTGSLHATGDEQGAFNGELVLNATQATFNVLDGSKTSGSPSFSAAGTYTLPGVQSCGPLNGTLSAVVAGAGNDITLSLAPTT